jgi:MFS family permease
MALAWFGAVQGVGLGLLPLAAALIIDSLGWRWAWVALGVFTIATGILPPLLLMARRPEDMGLEPDPAPAPDPEPAASDGPAQSIPTKRGEPDEWRDTDYTVREALRTPAFWILAFFSMVGFMAQSGVSLHQTAHYVGAGVPQGLAALVATAFALGQIPGGVVWALVGRRMPVRMMLTISAAWVTAGVFGIGFTTALGWGIFYGFLFGAGVGGMHTLLRLGWADYYGRVHLGAIRGLTLPAQIGGQAIGPVVSGFMFDASEGYRAPFVIFGTAVGLAALLVLAAVPPPRREG